MRNNMRKVFLHEELVTHIPNLMNAYGRFQYHSEPDKIWSLGNEIDHQKHVYELTAHFNNTDRRTTELQFGMDKMCCDFHSHLSRSLLGNNWTITKNLHKQPMLVCFFDHEGTRQRQSLARSVYPHIHGLLLIHDATFEKFIDITEKRPNERRYLLQKPWAFKEVSFKPTFNGVEGMKEFVSYALKFDKTSAKSGNNLFPWDIYPKSNKKWNSALNEIPENELRYYSSALKRYRN